jgi:hypothetical protein
MTYRNRRAACIENESLRVTVLGEGGHIAEILHKASGVNPLWTPPWPSMEPSTYDAAIHTAYGSGVESKLLAGIMGHNLCLDIFGGPSAEEAAAGLGVHGEASVAPSEIEAGESGLVMRSVFPLAQIRFERTIRLRGSTVEIHEAVESLLAFDRPIGWTQHVTLGPPFLEGGVTEFQTSATKSKVFEGEFGSADYLEPSAVFDWPMAPRSGGGIADLSEGAADLRGGVADLRVFNDAPVSSAFTAHLMDPRSEEAFFSAYHPAFNVRFEYSWKRADFPWLGIWEENRSRGHAPWNGVSIARGMDFGVSPMPESRRQMIDRGTLFGVPTYRWLPALGRLEARYQAGFRE